MTRQAQRVSYFLKADNHSCDNQGSAGEGTPGVRQHEDVPSLALLRLSHSTEQTVTKRAMQMPMFKPSHPGELLREDIVPALKSEKGIVGVSEFAERLGCSRSYLSNILQEKAPITAEFAACLELAGLGIAQNWLAMQAAYDQANAIALYN